MAGPSRGRLLTLLAVGILLLDGVLFLLAGLWTGSRPLLLWGALALAAAGGVTLAWRAQRRRLADIHATRHAIRDEAEALRQLVRRPPAPGP